MQLGRAGRKLVVLVTGSAPPAAVDPYDVSAFSARFGEQLSA